MTVMMNSWLLILAFAGACTAQQLPTVTVVPDVVTIGSSNVTVTCTLGDALVTSNNAFQWSNRSNVVPTGRVVITISSDNETAVLFINGVQRSEVGVFFCANTTQFTINSSGYAKLAGNQKEQKNVIQGDDLMLACDGFGYPMPTEILWFFANETLNVTSRHQLSSNAQNVTGGVLKVIQIDYAEEGEYQCKAVNAYGSSNTVTFKIKVKDRWAALWPFLGIVAEVIVLCTIILLYEKRQQAKMNAEDEKEEATHLAHDAEETAANEKVANGDDVRQRVKA